VVLIHPAKEVQRSEQAIATITIMIAATATIIAAAVVVDGRRRIHRICPPKLPS
jgi:hypothetical protein